MWPMGLLSSKRPVKQYSYENDFSGVVDALHQSFLVSLLDDCNLVQMVTPSTRDKKQKKNKKDLFLTSNHTLVNSSIVKSDISDHNLVYSEVYTKPTETRTYQIILFV